MGNYSEIEKLFQGVLEEKDRFRISAATEEICNKLKETEFKAQCLGEKERHIDTMESLLKIYSITFNGIMWKKIREEKDKLLECIEASGN